MPLRGISIVLKEVVFTLFTYLFKGMNVIYRKTPLAVLFTCSSQLSRLVVCRFVQMLCVSSVCLHVSHVPGCFPSSASSLASNGSAQSLSSLALAQKHTVPHGLLLLTTTGQQLTWTNSLADSVPFYVMASFFYMSELLGEDSHVGTAIKIVSAAVIWVI